MPQAQPDTIALMLKVTLKLLVKYTEPTPVIRPMNFAAVNLYKLKKTPNLESTGSLLIASAGYMF